MIHYGDITKISGYDVPIVDCVTFGAPCQDLSVAGKREGMKHKDKGDEETTRSGLFIDAIRIIKEMRENDRKLGRSGEFIRPRFAVYENVPGAFSSNKGQDFKIVLEELAKIAQEDAVIPMPPKGKWTTIGAIVGDGWSIAWRVLDAQFWGVPQRRRRIALVADFGGGCAQEILFERKSLRRDSEESRTERKSASADAEGCIGVYDRDGKKKCRGRERTFVAFCIGIGQANDASKPEKEVCKTLNCMVDPMKVLMVKEEPVICLQGNQVDRADTSVCNGSGFKEGTSYTLNVMDRHCVVYNGENITSPLNKTTPQIDAPCHTLTSDSRNYLVETKPHYIVRRLTPLECERLQGYADGWTDIGEYIDSKGKRKKTSDSSRYKALGNSIALPPWKWVIKRLCSHYERDATLASLFDGIGGFPCLWEQINGKGSCLWASEIEDFPIAVTKARIR